MHEFIERLKIFFPESKNYRIKVLKLNYIKLHAQCGFL